MNYENMLAYAKLVIESKDLNSNHSDDPEPLTEFDVRLNAARSLLTPEELVVIVFLTSKSRVCYWCGYGHQRISLGEDQQLHLEAVCSDLCGELLMANSEEI